MLLIKWGSIGFDKLNEDWGWKFFPGRPQLMRPGPETDGGCRTARCVHFLLPPQNVLSLQGKILLTQPLGSFVEKAIKDPT